MNQRKIIRQGDILLVPVPTSTVPAEAAPLPAENGRLILAHGEVTGHHHSVAETPSTALLATPNREMYLLIKEGDALLEHQEHTAHPVTGAYRVIRQREWTGVASEWRPVSD